MTDDGTLLTSILERRTDDGWMRANLSGDRFMEPIIDGVVEAYRDRYRPAPEIPFGPGHKVTLLRAGTGAFGHRYIDVMPGTLFAGSRGLGILPKGKRSKGYVVQNVLDTLDGYASEKVLRERIAELRAEWPEVRHLGLDDIKALPGGVRNKIHGAYFGKWFGGATIFFATNRLANDGDNHIVEGCMAIDPRYGDSEHGSIYADELRANFGVIDTPPLTFREALDLDWPTALQLCAQRTDKTGLVDA